MRRVYATAINFPCIITLRLIKKLSKCNLYFLNIILVNIDKKDLFYLPPPPSYNCPVRVKIWKSDAYQLFKNYLIHFNLDNMEVWSNLQKAHRKNAKNKCQHVKKGLFNYVRFWFAKQIIKKVLKPFHKYNVFFYSNGWPRKVGPGTCIPLPFLTLLAKS